MSSYPQPVGHRVENPALCSDSQPPGTEIRYVSLSGFEWNTTVAQQRVVNTISPELVLLPRPIFLCTASPACLK